MFELGNASRNMLLDNYEVNKYFSAEIDIDINDKNSSKVIICDNIKENSVCLDVGCGPGYLSKILHDYKKCKVYGLDLDKEALNHAKDLNCFEDLFNFSISDLEGSEYERFIKLNMKFDYIIFADVLEHMVNPDKVLLFFSKFLNNSGKIIVSIPNIAHFDIIKGLIDGKFNYNHIGLLDNTHLRFFTKKSFSEFIYNINEINKTKLSVKLIGQTVAVPDYFNRYPNISKYINETSESCVLQNIFEISQKGGKCEQYPETYIFDEIEVFMDSGNHAIIDLEYVLSENEKMKNSIKELEEKVQNLTEIIDKYNNKEEE